MKVIFFVAILQLILATVFATAPAAAPAGSPSAVCKLLIGVRGIYKHVDAPSGQCVDIPDTDHIYRIASETDEKVALKIFPQQKCPKGPSRQRETPVKLPYALRVRSFIATC